MLTRTTDGDEARALIKAGGTLVGVRYDEGRKASSHQPETAIPPKPVEWTIRRAGSK